MLLEVFFSHFLMISILLHLEKKYNHGPGIFFVCQWFKWIWKFELFCFFKNPHKYQLFPLISRTTRCDPVSTRFSSAWYQNGTAIKQLTTFGLMLGVKWKMRRWWRRPHPRTSLFSFSCDSFFWFSYPTSFLSSQY